MRRHPHLLEISAWPWLERLSRGEAREIRLDAVPAAEWDRIGRQGFDAVFLMGVWRRSAIGREIALTDPGLVQEYTRALPDWTAADVAGSPYCIQAYEPDERMGGWHGLDAARRELRDRGISLILDFVPNHTAFDHAWIQEHPERYVIGTDQDRRDAPGRFRSVDVRGRVIHIAYGRDPHFAGWTDVAQLNYFNLETRSAVQSTLREIAAHCDGVRCDMAMLVLNDVFEQTWGPGLAGKWARPEREFWIETTRSVPDLTFLAEVYWGLQGRLLDQGFQFAYDKGLYDILHSSDRAPRLRDMLSPDVPDRSHLARFLENHDEQRSAATLRGMLPAAASLLGSLPGMRFFFDGQLEGRRVRVPVQLGRWPDEAPEVTVRALYQRVLDFARDELLHQGDWALLPVSSAGDHSFGDIVAYRWRSGSALAVIAVNLGASASQAHIVLGEDLLPGRAFDFEDRLTGAVYRRTRDSLSGPGLYVRLEAGQAHLFNVYGREDR